MWAKMKRSQINAALQAARDLLARCQWDLPEWADWSEAEHAANPAVSACLYAQELGWDVTDFGQGDFEARGVTSFCIRNGEPALLSNQPGCEHLHFVADGQIWPFHAHKAKREEITVRCGGNLMVAFTRHGSFEDAPVWIDGSPINDPYSRFIRLSPGQSISIPCGLQHSLWSEPNSGPTLFSETSTSRNDRSDSFFLEEQTRFLPIDEDQPKLLPLWHETTAAH
jgi:D-lyxose ketol-isomerase